MADAKRLLLGTTFGLKVCPSWAGGGADRNDLY